MLEPPDLPNRTIVATVEANHGFAVVDISFLPLGYDSRAWAYRLAASNGSTYFLKIRRSIKNRTGLAIPFRWRQRGLTPVIAPIPTKLGELWAAAGDYAVVLYPFVDGQNDSDAGLSPKHWLTFGRLVRQIHETRLNPELMRMVRKESYALEWSPMVERLEVHISRGGFTDVNQQELASFWR
jgi:spectinomycin phosphotransferase